MYGGCVTKGFCGEDGRLGEATKLCKSQLCPEQRDAWEGTWDSQDEGHKEDEEGEGKEEGRFIM
ncbi:hypothetical protein VP1G_10779 [Cytospora mali]|uniref:Uncharacterized protein n=1 Tax=Cytospora mali TaxID=578113 RepID=A0A194UW47_CYTMA|nr:hypothetical protein VP1G_10779 [Valsa mali var. pyri (nom. inval.)]